MRSVPGPAARRRPAGARRSGSAFCSKRQVGRPPRKALAPARRRDSGSPGASLAKSRSRSASALAPAAPSSAAASAMLRWLAARHWSNEIVRNSTGRPSAYSTPRRSSDEPGSTRPMVSAVWPVRQHHGVVLGQEARVEAGRRAGDIRRLRRPHSGFLVEVRRPRGRCPRRAPVRRQAGWPRLAGGGRRARLRSGARRRAATASGRPPGARLRPRPPWSAPAVRSRPPRRQFASANARTYQMDSPKRPAA